MPPPDQPAPSDNVRVTFTDIAYGGNAVGRDPETGLTVFAWPGIVGETADVAVNLRRPSHLRGLVTQVHEVSPDRVVPPCLYYGTCGGCQWQHMAYPAQLAAMHSILRSQLMRLGGVADPDAVLREPVPSPQPFGYRNSSQFALDPQSRTLAYHMRGGRELVPVEQCPISNSVINRAIPLVNSMLVGAQTEEEAGEDRHGLMRLIRVAIRGSEQTGQTVVVFHTGKATTHGPRGGQKGSLSRQETSRQEEPNSEVTAGRNPMLLVSRREVKRVVKELAAHGAGNKLALMVVEVMSDGTLNLLGETKAFHAFGSEAVADTYTGSLLGRERDAVRDEKKDAPPLGAWIERLGGMSYWVAPHAFFQVNTDAAELLLAEVMSHVPARMVRAVDAHAGVGLFALQLADRCEQVIGFETERPSVTSAQWTAHASGIENVTFRVGRAEQIMPRLPAKLEFDLVVLDPPRAGCHPQLLAEIMKRAVPLVIYVSCDPSTLARDIKLLSPAYRLTSARVFDLFPQTYHIETVAVLERNG